LSNQGRTRSNRVRLWQSIQSPMKKLTVVRTVIEVGAGVALMCCPSATVALLLGSPLDTPAAVTLGRVTFHKYTIMEHLGLQDERPSWRKCPPSMEC
jgi:hypothetical protein